MHGAAPVGAVPSLENGRAGSVPHTEREAIAALDAEAEPGTPAWTHAGARKAEAGFKDPTLGWVGVRADASGGTVHAALVPDSEQAAQELGRHLGGLNTYLKEQHTPVGSLTMDAPGGRGADAAAGQGMGQGGERGTGHDPGQGPPQGTDQQANRPRGQESASTLGSGGAGGGTTQAATGQTPTVAAGPDGTTQETGGRQIRLVA